MYGLDEIKRMNRAADRKAAKAAKKDQVPSLTREDWAEIYYALSDKLASPAVVGDRGWTAHLKKIMKTIGPDGDWGLYKRMVK